jgi:hypothetical protein
MIIDLTNVQGTIPDALEVLLKDMLDGNVAIDNGTRLIAFNPQYASLDESVDGLTCEISDETKSIHEDPELKRILDLRSEANRIERKRKERLGLLPRDPSGVVEKVDSSLPWDSDNIKSAEKSFCTTQMEGYSRKKNGKYFLTGAKIHRKKDFREEFIEIERDVVNRQSRTTREWLRKNAVKITKRCFRRSQPGLKTNVN